MKKAIAVMTYARFDYFELTYYSIVNQIVNGRRVHDEYDIYIFQDGLWGEESFENKAGHRKISDFLDRIESSINVVRQSENLGVAFHFDFVERFLFNEKCYDYVVFHEDDLVLAPGYMSIIDMMGEKYARDPRVGMVSAHPADTSMSHDVQSASKNKYASMGHNWGFGLSKIFWQRRQPFVDCYLDLIRDVPYRKRSEERIFAWLKAAGFNPAASSQDYVKSCATYALGGVKLSTFANFALPIGRNGLHCNPAIFKKIGLDRSVVYEGKLDDIPDLDDTQYREIYLSGARQVSGDLVGLDSVAAWEYFKEWEIRAKKGDFHAKKIVPENKILQISNERQWAPSEIPARPHMEEQGVAHLELRMKGAEIFLEYGAGGSTILAASCGIKEIYSVESDRAFLDAVAFRLSEVGGVTFVPHYVDIGRTKEWGQPVDDSNARKWPQYCSSVWEVLRSGSREPDLVLIDGRFRVACFLISILFSKIGTIILFDDYYDRPNYHVVEKYAKPIERVGRMAEFRVAERIAFEEIAIDLLKSIADTN
ncbi:hypothetical protein [Burkholderia sp. FL-7-2-10-S1-D7]|uniref:hypothetical protein n=1 Tax=Burkholderia sp. FL-7-2-10-S1-D7 TaxID=1637866 RepID=UPI000B065EC1|nr:hypothetical protein [Burkholderia sp. FL-7-2-10-S1-D7]